MVRRPSSPGGSSSSCGQTGTMTSTFHTFGAPRLTGFNLNSSLPIPIGTFVRRTLVIEVGLAFASMESSIGRKSRRFVRTRIEPSHRGGSCGNSTNRGNDRSRIEGTAQRGASYHCSRCTRSSISRRRPRRSRCGAVGSGWPIATHPTKLTSSGTPNVR